MNEELAQKNENATESESRGASFTLQGSSNAMKCEERMQQLFDRPLCESTFTYGDCMDAQSVPPIHGTLYVSMLCFTESIEGTVSIVLFGGLGVGPDTIVCPTD